MEKVIAGERKYLAVKELTDGMEGERYAYLIRMHVGKDKNTNPFLAFYFRTIDKAVLRGTKFRVEENADLGLNVLKHNKALVRIKFTVQIYGGSFTLIVKECELLPREDASMFFDSYTHLEEKYEKLDQLSQQYINKSLPLESKKSSLFAIRHGVVGGFIELLDMVYAVLSARQTEHTEPLLKCFFSCVRPYFTYLGLIEKLEFLPKNEVLKLLYSASLADDELAAAVSADALSALMSESNPEHLYAHVIYNAFSTCLSQLRMEEAVQSAPKNLVIKMEDERSLIFY